ncbi:DUF3048 domain-containing protein [Cryobacterium sp. SO2]|uniref:DUF3048 domain-containing protein n=1 Tax=Cryobacterium sp. SO2 TaxID=1897060 RepID=UPI00223E08D4|nr:DUF3048 domain-containing protein [Cryobacterium sp. SO2]WEO76603.1 DUF3048 domain-containing protein [Cryobacterium sp. SO2]
MTALLTALRTPVRGGRSVGALVAVLSLALLCLALAGCVAPLPEPIPSASRTPVPSIAPLRGTPVDPVSAEHPALAVKIDNHPAARPQIGLERADLVFEELVEGGLTRYAALWHSDVPGAVGPVRSIRPMDPDILSPFGGIVAYSGGQPQFVAAMQATGLENVIFDQDDTGVFERTSDRKSPHNVVLAAADVVAAHADLAPPPRQFDYADGPADATAVLEGDPTSTIVTSFSDSSGRAWAWDPATQVYLRSQDGAADLDTAGNQLGATNVVVLRVDVDRGSDVPRTLLTGSGEAWVSTGGSTMPATWVKDAAVAPIRLADAAGASIDLAPGNTWIELVPADDGSVELVP